MAPGVFQTSSDGRRVFFIERESADGVNARNVFILARQDDGESVTSARAGRLETSDDARYLVLERGQRNDTHIASGERTLSSFERYRVLAGERAVRSAESRPPRAVRTIELMRQPTPRHQGELTWRFGLLLGAANLLLLGDRPGCHQPAPRQQLEPAVRADGLRRLLQPHQPLAGLGVQRAHADGQWRWRCCTAAPSWRRWRCCGGATMPPCSASGASPRRRRGGRGMRTVRRLLYRDIVASVLFVALAFLSLFFFIDFVDELDGVGSRGRTAWHAVLAAVLELPGHLYELLPIAVLIGTIYSLARLAQSSEFTILRTGGLGPGRALSLLAVLGVVFGVLTFVIGDYLAPASEREGVLLKARFSGGIEFGGAGAWLKEKRRAADGEHSYSVNVAGATAAGALAGIRIFEFDADGRLVARTEAREGRVGDDGVWQLSDARVARWPVARSEDADRDHGNPCHAWPGPAR